MRRTNLLACDEAESFLATADGKSLLVYTGDDEQPLWQGQCDGTILGVGVTDEEVITLDDSGALIWWDGESGERTDEVEVEGKPKGLAVDADGVAAVLTQEGVQVVDPGDEAPRSLRLSGARAIAWGRGAEPQLAVGDRDGVVHVYDEADLEPLGTVKLPEAVQSIVGVAGGEWVVAAGSALHEIAADAESARKLLDLATADGEPAKPDCLTASADGTVVACRLAADRVEAWDRAGSKRVARAVYGDRSVVGVAFGGKSWLGIGLDGGDANRISLRTGAVRHTETPEGREARQAAPVVEVTKLDRRARAARPATGPVGGGARRPPVAKTEADVPVPDRQTLGMLGVVALSTLVMWGAAKFACNSHPPESKKPREVGTVELAGTPKDAAIEMVQRLASYEFDRALELADTGPAQEVERQLRECEAAGKDACEAKRKAAVGKVLTTAEVLRATTSTASARVTTTGPDGTRVYSVDLVNSPPIWKVTRLAPEAG